MRKLLVVTVVMQFSLTLPLMARGNDNSTMHVPDQADQRSTAHPPTTGQDAVTEAASGSKETKTKKKGKQAQHKQPSGTLAKKIGTVPRLTTATPTLTGSRVEGPAPKPVVNLQGATPARALATSQERQAPADKK